MEYSEENIMAVLEDWERQGFTDVYILKKGMFFSIKEQRHLLVSHAVQVYTVWVTNSDEGTQWTMHALQFKEDHSKGLFLYGRDFYQDWEVTSEIRKLIKPCTPTFNTDYLQ
jgi:hypothetical protein